MISPRKRIWGWYFFDWASQPYNTLLLTFVFGPYFTEIAMGYYFGQGLDPDAAAAAAQSFWGWGIAGSSVVIAILAPILGAMADSTGRRMVWIWIFSALYVLGAWALWWVAPGGDIGVLYWAVICFGLGFIGMEFATIFTNALMPSLSDHEDLGAISGSGFAFGYLGGLAALVVMLGLFVPNPENGLTYLGLNPLLGEDAETQIGTRVVGPFTAIWYMVFMVPFFLWVKEPKTQAAGISVKKAVGQVKEMLASLRYRNSLVAYLGSSLLYRDALNALYAFGGVYAKGVLGWSIGQIGIFGLVGAASAVFASWLGGKADRRYGPKPVIALSIVVLIAICLLIVGMTREQIWGFALDPAGSASDQILFVCGALIGAAGGSLQASSRTMMVRHTTPERATEAFGLFALSGKVSSFVAPVLIALVTAISGSQRIGISPLIALFLIGLILLIWVNPKGEQSR
ncbi:MFS transporter [Xinfangfangia sp. CPCC 101601]|uniref:MFS transporter n=1 Tax=Pseudogemmobacter lacusdianii TaxID=3069608 RepID=A0ABU0VXL3_9RHOB|nr:MFS transporter [Xinfangfangia sp. CPCC 101601]MDQ2066501.1 MFS transporter [Xinfangfangia sp. CPCC 101601]